MTEAENLIPVAVIVLAASAAIAMLRGASSEISASAPLTRRILFAAWIVSSSVSIYINIAHFDMMSLNDDTFITYRYAENFSSGMGLVYNEGERVFGTTTILFSLMLGGVKFVSPTASVPDVAVLFNLGFHALATLLALFYLPPLLERWGKSFQLPSLLFFLVIVVLSPAFISLMYGGEVGLLVFLVACCLVLLRERRLFLLSFVLFLLLMSRIDTVVFTALTWLYLLLFVRDVPFRRKLAAFGTFAALTAFGVGLTTLYFGSFIPNTVVAKDLVFRQFGAAGRGAYGVWDFFELLFDDVYWGTIEQRLLSLLFLVGVVGALVKKQHEVLLAAASVVGYFVFLASFEVARAGYWYTPQYMLLYYMVCCLGFFVVGNLSRDAAQRFAPRLLSGARQIAVAVVVMTSVTALVAIPSIASLDRKETSLRRAFKENDLRICVGKAIGALVAEASGPLLAGDIGKLGYFSGAYILDMRGLVSPQVFPYYRDGSAVRGIIMGEQPTYIGLSPRAIRTNRETNVPTNEFSRWFRRRYEVVDTGCGSENTLTVYARTDR